MEPNQRNAWIAGATGLVGGFLVGQLLASKSYAQAIAILRRRLDLSDNKLDQRVIDFDQLQTLELPPASDIFCVLGTTIGKAGSQAVFRRVDLEYPLALANKALQAGAEQFLLVSSVGANAPSTNFYLRTKGELEAAVSALPFHAVHIFRPSLLVGPRQERRLGERVGSVVMKLAAPMLVGGLRKYRPIAAEDVARAMVAAALHSGSGTNVYEYDQIMELASSSRK